MEYLEWGSTENKASVIGLGCMRMANITLAEADKVVKTALDSGINFFDHADIYGGGKSESLFGQVLAKNPSIRDRIFIQSKCAIHDGMYDFSKDYILKSVDGILDRLGTDHLDCLLLHRPDALMEPDEVNQAFTELHKAGKVLSFGVSNMNRFQIELLQGGLDYQISADQLQMSLAHTPMIDEGINVNTQFDGAVTRASGTLEYCRQNGIVVQCWSPIQKGFFGGPFIGDPSYSELNEVLGSLAEQYHVKPDAIAYSWLLRYPAKMQVILGTMNATRIQNAAKAADIRLTREQWYSLYKAAGNKLP